MEQFFALKRKLVMALSITIAVGFFLSLLVNYSVEKAAVHHALVHQQLPLTSNSIYSDLKDDDLGLFITPTPTAHQQNYLDYLDYGLKLEKINTLIRLYKKEYGHDISLVNMNGDIIASTHKDTIKAQANIYKIDSFSLISEDIIHQKKGSYQYQHNGDTYLLNTRYIPDFKWQILVDTNEDVATKTIRQSLYINIFIGFFIILTAIFFINTSMNSHQWQLKKMINEIATSDALTGLASRRTFDIMIGHILANSLRNQNPVNLILLEIDKLKEIHCQHGILAVENIIQQIGGLIKSSIRASDVGCRWSDEQFMITLNQCHADKAHIIAESLRMNIESAIIKHNNQTMNMTLSIGLSQYHVNDSASSLVERTQEALLQAKNLGSNKVVSLKAPYLLPETIARQSPQRFSSPVQMPV